MNYESHRGYTYGKVVLFFIKTSALYQSYDLFIKLMLREIRQFKIPLIGPQI